MCKEPSEVLRIGVVGTTSLTTEELKKAIASVSSSVIAPMSTPVIAPPVEVISPVDKLIESMKAHSGDVYTLDIDKRIPSDSLARMFERIRSTMDRAGIQKPLVLLAEDINFNGISRFDWSVALKLLKQGHRVTREHWEGFLYMKEGIIFHSLEGNKEWIPTQKAILACDWRRD